MASFVDSLLDGSQLVIETQVAPTFTIDLGGPSSGVSGFVGKIARPKITVVKNGSTVTTIAPYGEPAVQGWLIALLVGFVLLLWVAK